jgi:arsenite methyltransferase
MSDMNAEHVRETVRQGYGRIAGNGGSCCGPPPACCGSASAASNRLAEHIGYTPEELAALPEGVNMGLSCGNPNALAALQPGERVLDLGAGGGFDLFIAGRKVGPTGRAIGVDMTSEMLARARQSIATYREHSGLDNVEFRLGEIEHLPVADNSVDVVISNCVINLSPDKPQVWREIARVLKPGGRVAVSDLALLQPLPPAVAESVEALVGCVAGAVLVPETERMAQEAGLGDVRLETKSAYVDGMADWQDPLYQKLLAQLPPGMKPGDYVTSLEVTARKPGLADNPPRPAQARRSVARRLDVYDPALCCSSGVCGPEVDPALVQFAAHLQQVQEQGVEVRRFNLAQNPAAFVENEQVRQALTNNGESALPLLLVDGRELARGRYPGWRELEVAVGLDPGAASLLSPAVAELVAMGAAVAANCEPCLEHHYREAQALGVTREDMSRAVEMGAKVKDTPHQSILRLADRLTGTGLAGPAAGAEACCAPEEGGKGTTTTPCCG